ncbi:MAG: family 20 glycosylhydrolase [Tannerella sp.]|nr:family 20 glycosylhydrolase [Tannerella sp.]
MKYYFNLLIISALAFSACSEATVQRDLNIVPYPKTVSIYQGDLTLLAGEIAVKTDVGAAALADVISDDILTLTGTKISATNSEATVNVKIKASLAEDEYTVNVTDKQVEIAGGSYQAVVFAWSSVLQAAEIAGGKIVIPKMKIKDCPDLKYRGLLIDLARNFHSYNTVKQMIDLCRWYKINYLQLHLTDDQSFVFPSTAFPALIDENRCYTKQQIKEIVDYAQSRGVELVPELEGPGHSTFLRSKLPDVFGKPDYGCIDLASEKTLQAMQTLTSEMIDAFHNSKYFHIGADETNLEELRKLPHVEQYIAEKGFDDVHDLYLDYIVKMREFIHAKDRRLCLWEGFDKDGSAKVKIPKDVLVFEFETYYQRPDSLVAQGYHLINTSWKPIYITQGKQWSPEEIYTSWNYYTWKNWWEKAPATKEPIVVEERYRNRIEGVQMCAWELRDEMEYPALCRRLAALSEKAWDAASSDGIASSNAIGNSNGAAQSNAIGQNYASFASRLIPAEARIRQIVTAHQHDDAKPLYYPEPRPRIVNIINFIRNVEPRDEKITEDVLYQTVVEQLKQLHAYKLHGTFLLQYDALINPKYQTLLKPEMAHGMEIGAWWEITQPHVEACGIQWRGRFPWDWHADVGFATGYTPEEREKLVDVYMEKFKDVFGCYPVSVGSWFIDAHTLGYLYDKYHIIASCNCKDQIGTDGYTLWGGYWNQAYYPSRRNAYMPAQTAEGQIPVPIFRMLGSDPIYQYEAGLGGSRQHVVSLEPVYKGGGGNRQWVEWFFDNMFNNTCLAFNYVQAGQENSFTWDAMKDGLAIQIPLLDSLFRKGAIRVETLEESGRWFRQNFPLTPATAVTVLTDNQGNNNKSVWFNSRFYRVNMVWEGDSFRIRDIHLFDERLKSDYLERAGTSTQCVFETLPVLDGCKWSTATQKAGLRLTDAAGRQLRTSAPKVSELFENILKVSFTTVEGHSFELIFNEKTFEIRCTSNSNNSPWYLTFTTADGVSLPFTDVRSGTVYADYKGFTYKFSLTDGSPELLSDSHYRIAPNAGGKITVDCSLR